MKRLTALAVVAAGVALAVVIGQRMSTDAMAVAIGVVFGVAASIPTSLLIVAATRGRREEPPRYSQPDFRPPAQPPPQIYIVSPNGATQQQPWFNGTPQFPAPPVGYGSSYGGPQRRYTLIGGGDDYDSAD